MASYGLVACTGKHPQTPLSKAPLPATGSVAAPQRPCSTPQGKRSATTTLAWHIPRLTTAGTESLHLAGYRLHYGRSSLSYPLTVTIADPSARRYVMTGLAPGEYFFAISSFDSAGQDSALSSEVCIRIR